MKSNIVTIEGSLRKDVFMIVIHLNLFIGVIAHIYEPGSLGCGLKVWVTEGSPQMVQKPQRWRTRPPSPRPLVLGSRKASSTAAHQF